MVDGLYDVPMLVFCASLVNLLVTATLIRIEKSKLRSEQALRLQAEERYARLHRMCNQFRRRV